MTNLMKMTMFLLGAVLLSVTAMALDDEPAVLLIEAKGKVLYSADGTVWKDVSRNKFLFENWHMKTGDDGTCKLLNQHRETIEQVGTNTELEIHRDGPKVIKGTVSKAEPAKSLAGYFNRKFADVQKYTGIRRYDRKGGEPKLMTAADITVSRDYPELVWENAGPEYSYKVLIGESAYEVPGSGEDLIRFRVPRQKEGQAAYCVQIVHEDEVIYNPEKMNTLRWLPDAEENALREEERELGKIAENNGFLLGNLMDARNIKVAAMDQYRAYLSENPDANEARPFLIKVLNELKLEKLEKSEMMNFHCQSKQ